MKVQVVVRFSSTIIEHSSNICPIESCTFCCRTNTIPVRQIPGLQP